MGKSSVVFDGDVQELIDSVFRNGYVVIKSFFDVVCVLEARAQLLMLLERDLKARKEFEYKRPVRMDEGLYKTSLTPLMHTRLFPSFESEAYSAMLDDMFLSDVVNIFMRSVVGDSYRLRVDLIRRSTGIDDTIDDFQVPHEWHRDTPGEFTFGIFFDDVSAPASGGTAVISGTHFEKYDPRWDLLLSKNGRPDRESFLSGEIKHVPDDIYDLAVWNKKARSDLEGLPVEIVGGLGDIYFFLNDTWHGRFPNRSGKELMISRVGGFSTDFSFKDDLPLPFEVERLPYKLRSLYADDQPMNCNSETLMRKILSRSSLSSVREKAAEEKVELMRFLRLSRSG